MYFFADTIIILDGIFYLDVEELGMATKFGDGLEMVFAVCFDEEVKGGDMEVETEGVFVFTVGEGFFLKKGEMFLQKEEAK